MKQKLLTFLLLGLIAISSAFAQADRTVTGKVLGRDDGLPLPGVSVRVKGSAIGTTTGPDGNYTISSGSPIDRCSRSIFQYFY